ncbi:MAG: UbiA family prenyltransferase [Nitrososphaerota archaeon]
MSIVEWVRIGRIHTAALTMPITLLGYVLAGGIDLLTGLGWVLFALLWHYVGFLQNNIFDYRYDRADPEKSHFPLVRGSIGIREAMIVDSIGLIALVSFGALMAWNPVSLAFLSAGVASGTVYNAFSKRTLLKPIPISICFASLPMIPYTSLRPFDDVGAMLFAAVFTSILYQIGYSGELKDIERAEANILRRIGGLTPTYAALLKIINIVFITLLFARLALSGMVFTFFTANAVVVVSLSLAVIILLNAQIRDYESYIAGVWDRVSALKRMSWMEVVTYWLLVSAVSPVIGVYAVLWAIIPLLWFIAWNRILWGTKTYPRV